MCGIRSRIKMEHGEFTGPDLKQRDNGHRMSIIQAPFIDLQPHGSTSHFRVEAIARTYLVNIITKTYDNDEFNL